MGALRDKVNQICDANEKMQSQIRSLKSTLDRAERCGYNMEDHNYAMNEMNKNYSHISNIANYIDKIASS